MSRGKVYVVWQGRQPGVYPTWEHCRAQVEGFPGARYRSYPDRATAEQAFFGGSAASFPSPVYPSYAVDGACAGNPGVMEYRGVDTASGAEIFHEGPYPLGTNNLAEFLALVTALQWCAARGCDWPIYSDSQIALDWVRRGRCRTQFPVENTPLAAKLRAAEAWLATHSYRNPLYKWDTRRWGPIPADFGRK
ncbi:ribonuclease H1 domain-containing protein [Gloeomargarita sp.]